MSVHVKYLFSYIFFMEQGAKDQIYRLMVSVYHRPWTPAILNGDGGGERGWDMGPRYPHSLDHSLISFL